MAVQYKSLTPFWCFLLLLVLASSASAQTVVTSLPGFSGNLPFFLETGYIGVGELDEVQLFYYFFRSQQKPEDAPLLLWLPAGLGCSALSSILYEIGPIAFDSDNSTGGRHPVLELNEYAWTKVANIIFLDSPVGTGFSYSTTSEGYNTSDTKTVANIYEFIRKWLVIHPQYQTNQLIIGGESYSGIIVPALVQTILDGQEAGDYPGLNLNGYVLGNPLTDVHYDVNSRVEYAHRVALLSDDIYEHAKNQCHGDYLNPNINETACIEDLQMIYRCVEDINAAMILEPKCGAFSPKSHNLKWDLGSLGLNLSDSLILDADPLSFPRYCRNYDYLFVNVWANDLAVQEALNVRNGTIGEWERCNKSLAYTFNISSSLQYHQNFTSKDLRALIYSGDHDLIIPHVGTEAWIATLNLTLSSDDEWRPYYINGQVGGYVELYHKEKFSLTYATVKGAGHTAPEYRPLESYNMIGRWLAYYFL